ncbi:hypothetical protein VC178_01395 [Polynucleobacter sp. AP-Sanab-80-C2]|uniref:hypothetical protein n=1 Tax=Polynucleobacter sp. AP-Sanab-80-C2 TaxID=3108274 RepID=UPI002B22EA7D|nr:hypothetical protein [Polynucleobacter sp. AP-Sanab-80-C2]MEA9598548.1 hypothetical protein [Polynucleobacter sp. AP-Sanab-80-C2]
MKQLINQFKKIKTLLKLLVSLNVRLNQLQIAVGRIEARQLLGDVAPKNLNDYEFQVYSQFGEDGLIQYLIKNIQINNSVFVEFGVERYLEANTRFLLSNNGWRGLIIDGSLENIAHIKSDEIYWKSDITAVSQFIDCENINQVIDENGIRGEIGLLSIDIDGNDYWVWKSINIIDPQIVICEFNNLWGPNLKVTTPYDPLFFRGNAHYSNLYFGASLGALEDLAYSKGYAMVGINLAGNNAFFVKKTNLGALSAVKTQDVWRPSKFRESRGPDGSLSYISRKQGIEVLANLPLMSIEDGQLYQIRELFGKIDAHCI